MFQVMKAYMPTPPTPAPASPFHADFVKFHAGYSTELGICVPREYWLVVGERF